MSNFHISDRSLAGYRAAVTRKLSSSKAAISVANPVLVTVKGTGRSEVEISRNITFLKKFSLSRVAFEKM